MIRKGWRLSDRLIRSENKIGQPEGQLRYIGDQNEHQHQRDQEGQYGHGDLLEGYLADLNHDVKSDPHWRCRNADQQGKLEDNSEMHPVDAEGIDNRQQHRHQHQLDRHAFNHTADQQHEDKDKRQKDGP